mmetsp:Transcript_1229/g.2915  ORF Transcript_1229/g.2915 Transcript_1229/m.2915 type:complete len:209 (+) Transcript_1229:2317-2943(+)
MDEECCAASRGRCRARSARIVSRRIRHSTAAGNSITKSKEEFRADGAEACCPVLLSSHHAHWERTNIVFRKLCFPVIHSQAWRGRIRLRDRQVPWQRGRSHNAIQGGPKEAACHGAIPSTKAQPGDEWSRQSKRRRDVHAGIRRIIRACCDVCVVRANQGANPRRRANDLHRIFARVQRRAWQPRVSNGIRVHIVVRVRLVVVSIPER